MAYSMSCKNGHFKKEKVAASHEKHSVSLSYWCGKVQDHDNCKKCVLLGIALSNLFSTTFYLW